LDNEKLRTNYPIILEQLKKQEKYIQALEQRDKNFYRTIFESQPDFESDGRFKRLEVMLEASGPQLIHSLGQEYSYMVDTLTEHFRMHRQDIELPDTAALASQLDNIPAIEPLVNENISSGYGYRIHPIYKIQKFNYGLDYQCKAGTPVLATAAGKVIYAGSKGGYGNTIIIRHKEGLETWYTHLKAIKVRRGRKVNRAQFIGFVGNTGVSISPHLHYEVHVDGQAVNPVSYFFAQYSPETLMELSKSSSRMGQSL